jgi:hypothetical protein
MFTINVPAIGGTEIQERRRRQLASLFVAEDRGSHQ